MLVVLEWLVLSVVKLVLVVLLEVVICMLVAVDCLLVTLLVLSLDVLVDCFLWMVLEALLCVFSEVSMVCGNFLGD